MSTGTKDLNKLLTRCLDRREHYDNVCKQKYSRYELGLFKGTFEEFKNSISHEEGKVEFYDEMIEMIEDLIGKED